MNFIIYMRTEVVYLFADILVAFKWIQVMSIVVSQVSQSGAERTILVEIELRGVRGVLEKSMLFLMKAS